MLSEIARRYYRLDLKKLRKVRTVAEWSNEYEGAQVQLLYTFDDKTFEETVVEWLFNLRDYLVSHKMDFNAFRRYVADIAVLTAHRNPAMYSSILEVVRTLGCNIRLSLKDTSPPMIEDEKLLPLLGNLSALFESRPEEVVKVTIHVRTRGDSLPNYPVQIANAVQEHGTTKKAGTTVTTGSDGTVAVPVRKFSILEIGVKDPINEALIGDTKVSRESMTDDKSLKLLVGDRNINVSIDVKHSPKLEEIVIDVKHSSKLRKIAYVALALAGIATLLALLLLFLT